MCAVKVLVPISGGKDSQACLKLALQKFPASEVRGLFCDTQFEHPITYAHVEKLRTLYGPVRIDTVCGGSVLEDEFGAQQKAKVQVVAIQIGKSMWTSKGGKARNEAPCSLMCSD